MISDSIIKLEENYGKYLFFVLNKRFYFVFSSAQKKLKIGDAGNDTLAENVEKEEKKDTEKKKKHRSDRSRSR